MERAENDRHVLLGRFYHELVKETADREKRARETKDLVDDAFWAVAQDFSKRYPGLDLEYEPYVQHIYDTVERRIDFKFGLPRELFVETELVSRDGLLFGTPDWVMISDEGVELVDLKLSANPEKLRSERNIAQLAFYAYLVEEAYGLHPTRVRLIGLNGAEAEVQVSRERAGALANDAREILRVFSDAKDGRLSLEEIARPSHPACLHCRYSHICERAML